MDPLDLPFISTMHIRYIRSTLGLEISHSHFKPTATIMITTTQCISSTMITTTSIMLSSLAGSVVTGLCVSDTYRIIDYK